MEKECINIRCPKRILYTSSKPTKLACASDYRVRMDQENPRRNGYSVIGIAQVMNCAIFRIVPQIADEGNDAKKSEHPKFDGFSKG